MEKIKSFTINHDTLQVGLYTSRIDGDIATYDVRMFRPNIGEFLSTASAHTIEHLFATYARNSEYKDGIVYVGPMGCRTGCYLLTTGIEPKNVIDLVQKSFEFIANFEGEIPGAKKSECGNYLDHDLQAAKHDIIQFRKAIKGYTVQQLEYAE